MTNKKILIGIPDHFDLPNRFKKNLEKLGFEVFMLEHDNTRIKVPIKDYLYHGYSKIMLGDKSHKPKIRNQIKEIKQIDFLNNIKEKIDYSLLIRPDLFSLNVIRKIKEKAGFSVAYQWDGLDRFPNAKELINEFDRFYVFDVNDEKENVNCIFTTNFYFDDIFPEIEKIEKNKLFFVGSIMGDRIRFLSKISTKLNRLGLTPYIYLNYFSEKKVAEFLEEPLIFIKNQMSFDENLYNVLNSEYLLDLHNPVHHGISFRAFESIGFKKKLITNNKLVKDYDFYNPNNVFVFENDDLTGLENFITKPYEELDYQIFKKYSFSNWIENILQFKIH